MFSDFCMPARGFVILNGNVVSFFTTNSDRVPVAAGNELSKVKMTSLAIALNDVKRGHELSSELFYVHVPFDLILAYVNTVGLVWMRLR
jgi:hypothetical protein